MSRIQKLLFVGLLVVAAIVRTGYYVQIRDYVLYRVPLIDAEEYVEWGTALAAGREEVRDVYYKAPLYPHVLGWGMRVFGAETSTAHLLNTFLGILNIFLIGVWVRRVAGAAWALTAVATAACYGPFLHHEAQPLPTILALTLATISLLALSSSACRPGRIAASIAGVSLGLLALTRPSFMLWVLAASAWVWLGPPRSLKRALLVLMLAALVILPVTLRNRIVGKSWVLISANGGINFFLGNNADAARTSAMRPGLEWEVLVTSVPASERLGQARWDRYFGRQAWEWVSAHPGDFLAGLGQKTLQYFNVHEIDRNLDARGFRAQSSLLRWAPRYACLAPWILLGLVVAWRRGSAARLATLYFLAIMASTVVIFVTERYRTDAAPAGIALALLGLAECWSQLRRRNTALRPLTAILLLVLGGVLALNNFLAIRDINPAQATVLEGMGFYKEARYVRAIESFRQALVEYPGDANAHYQLGTALQKQNRFQEALVEFEAASRAVPDHPKPLVGAGAILRREGKLEEARRRYSKALEIDGANAIIHLELASLLEELRDVPAAATHYRRVLEHTDEPLLRQEAMRGLRRLQVNP